jgi:hypothetical protein
VMPSKLKGWSRLVLMSMSETLQVNNSIPIYLGIKWQKFQLLFISACRFSHFRSQKVEATQRTTRDDPKLKVRYVHNPHVLQCTYLHVHLLCWCIDPMQHERISAFAPWTFTWTPGGLYSVSNLF